MPGTPGELTYAKDIPALLRSTRQGFGSHLDVDDWENRRRPRHGASRRSRRGHDQADRQMQRHDRVADRPAEDDRRAGAAVDSHGQADLLGDERHAFGRNRRARNAARTAYRIAVEETPFIQAIRNNVITLITPVIEVDGREKHVDTYYFNKKRPAAEPRLPLMYWGKCVAHDNNRDGMGQFLALTRNTTRTFLDWKPTVLHDLHEASTYSMPRLARVPITSRSIPSRSTSGGCLRRPKSWR